MSKATLISIAVSASLVALAFLFTSSAPGSAGTQTPVAQMEGATQVIDITAKGGYSPRVVEAKAGIPTVIRVRTSGTYDCSASVVIPKLSYRKFLEPSAVEEIPLTAAQATGTLQGLCAMGMYNFRIIFQ